MATRFSRYLSTIAELNGLDHPKGPVEWIFFNGMLFLSRDKWWGDFMYRATAHEGIDITFFKANGSSGHDLGAGHLDAGAFVPAFADGTVLQICNDFLGQSIIADLPGGAGKHSYTVLVYAHIRPEPHLSLGDNIKKNKVIARVCDTHKNPQLTPHLHFSCFEIPNDISPGRLNWNLFSQQQEIRMINPVFV